MAELIFRNVAREKQKIAHYGTHAPTSNQKGKLILAGISWM